MVTTTDIPVEAWPEPLDVDLPPSDVPVEDGIPLESDWHRSQINLLIELIRTWWHDRTDFFAGGNMFVYYSTESVEKARRLEYRGPDFFVAIGVDGTRDREAWKTWEEDGHAPNLIVELLSPRTESEDLGRKKTIYAQVMRVPEYIAYRPSDDTLYAWRLEHGAYQPVEPDAQGRIWLETVQAWIGRWDGVFLQTNRRWLRFWDVSGNLVPTSAESEHDRAERLAALLREHGINPDAAT